MISIELRNIGMHAFHGIYEGEEKIGNDYVLNVDVKYDEGESDFDYIKNTIDYVDLFELIRQRMQIPTPLLEKVCESIIGKIRHQYPFIKEVTLSIHKIQPPIEHFQGTVGVSMNKKFHD